MNFYSGLFKTTNYKNFKRLSVFSKNQKMIIRNVNIPSIAEGFHLQSFINFSIFEEIMEYFKKAKISIINTSEKNSFFIKFLHILK